MKTISRGLLIGAALSALATPAFAHRQWLLPSATVFSGADDWVAFDSAVSNDLFFADHRPGNLQAIKVWAPDGTPGQIEHGASGETRSIFDVHLTKPGTWKVGTQNANVMGSFKVDGEERRVGGGRGPGGPGGPGAAGGPGGPGGPGAPGGAPRKPPVALADIPANATDVKLTESINRNEVFVTAGAPTSTVFKPTGKGLEFDPVTHPSELVSNEPARFRFLIDGKPAANLKVTLIAGGKKFRDGEQLMELTTANDGLVTVKWPMPGMYWVNATASDKNPSEPRATERRMSYTTTVEVPAP
jgi:hypothetical protein